MRRAVGLYLQRHGGNADQFVRRGCVKLPCKALRRRPDHQVLSGAGFEVAGRYEFTAGHRWSLPELAGYIRSTSFLPASVLGVQAAAFDADLAASLGPHGDGGGFTETVSFAFELARKPA